MNIELLHHSVKALDHAKSIDMPTGSDHILVEGLPTLNSEHLNPIEFGVELSDGTRLAEDSVALRKVLLASKPGTIISFIDPGEQRIDLKKVRNSNPLLQKMLLSESIGVYHPVEKNGRPMPHLRIESPKNRQWGIVIAQQKWSEKVIAVKSLLETYGKKDLHLESIMAVAFGVLGSQVKPNDSLDGLACKVSHMSGGAEFGSTKSLIAQATSSDGQILPINLTGEIPYRLVRFRRDPATLTLASLTEEDLVGTEKFGLSRDHLTQIGMANRAIAFAANNRTDFGQDITPAGQQQHQIEVLNTFGTAIEQLPRMIRNGDPVSLMLEAHHNALNRKQF
jgi:hypothetical protein